VSKAIPQSVCTGGLAAQQRTVHVGDLATPGVGGYGGKQAVGVQIGQRHAGDQRGDAVECRGGLRRVPGVCWSAGQHQHVGELDLGQRHLRDRAVVLGTRLQPALLKSVFPGGFGEQFA
jgi:hypothetical protein